MKSRLVLIISFWIAAPLLLAAGEENEAGRKIEQQSCIQCHSLRLVDSQRLSLAAWRKEVDKMIGWGAVVSDKELLIQYLSDHYGTNRTPPAPVLSTDTK
jgi:mono/diheme cytochrome c family protein